MVKIQELSVKYVTDEAGKKTDVVVPIDEFEALMEDLLDLAAVAERRDELTLTHEEVLKQLKQDGLL